MTTMLRAALLAGALLCTTPPAEAEGFAGRAALAALDGRWASPAPEPWHGGYGTRGFTFRDGRWHLVFTHALDPAMQARTFQFRTYGPYRVEATSPAAAGAFEAVFVEERKLVTLLTDDPRIIRAFGFAGCGLVLGVEVDISARGCAGWKPVADCAEDHDLMALGSQGLHFGVRPRDNDMCTPDRRPTALLPAVVAR